MIKIFDLNGSKAARGEREARKKEASAPKKKANKKSKKAYKNTKKSEKQPTPPPQQPHPEPEPPRPQPQPQPPKGLKPKEPEKKDKEKEEKDQQQQQKPEKPKPEEMQTLPRQQTTRRGSASSVSTMTEEPPPSTSSLSTYQNSYPIPSKHHYEYNPRHLSSSLCAGGGGPDRRMALLRHHNRPPTPPHPIWNPSLSHTFNLQQLHQNQFHHSARFSSQTQSAFLQQGLTSQLQFGPGPPGGNQQQHATSPTSFHIPFAGGIFKGGRQGSLNGGGRLNSKMQSSSDYFGQFHHLMQRGPDAPLPVPPPIIPHQYYNYMMHTHLNNIQPVDCQSLNSPTPGSMGGMETGLGGDSRASPAPAVPQSPGIHNPSSNLGAAQHGYRNGDAWTREANQSYVKTNMPGYRILKDATTTHIICSVCCRKNGRLCSACGHVAYCSVKCQKIDWPRHRRAECRPSVAFDKDLILSKLKGEKQSESDENCGISEENGGGDGPGSDRTTVVFTEEEEQEEEASCHHPESESDAYSGKFIARRFIKQGESIYLAKPIMMASNDKGLPHPPDSILCLECCRWYQSSTGYRCSKCLWPVCCVECENGNLHSKYECPVFVDNSVSPPPNNDYTQFYDDAILALRVILMKVYEPDKFKELIQWKDVEKSLSKTSKWMDYDSRIVAFLLDSCNLAQLVNGLTNEKIQTILTLIDATAIVMDDRVAFRETELAKTFHSAKYVIPNKLLLSEECSPNCKWSIHHSVRVDDCSLRIHTSTDVQPGSYLTACFSSIWKFGASFIHRYEDFRFDFICSCRRCNDRTEFGSFFSGIKCKQCEVGEPEGYLLPIDPSNSLTDWDCQNQQCKARCKGQVVIEEVNRLHNTIKFYHNDYWQLVGFVFDNNVKVLHSNHFLMFKACWSCLELFWGSLKGLPFFSQRYEFFNSCTYVAKKALEVLDVILPGASIQRGRILFLLSLAEAYRTLRDYRRYLEWGGEDAKKCISRPFWTIQNIQREAYEILITEPYGSMEHRMAVMLQETIEDQIDLLCHTPLNVPLDHMVIYVLHKIYTRFTSSFYEPSIPLFEDEDISKFVVSTGPVASHLITKKPNVI